MFAVHSLQRHHFESCPSNASTCYFLSAAEKMSRDFEKRSIRMCYLHDKNDIHISSGLLYIHQN